MRLPRSENADVNRIHTGLGRAMYVADGDRRIRSLLHVVRTFRMGDSNNINASLPIQVEEVRYVDVIQG
jgi:hypothetical protein